MREILFIFLFLLSLIASGCYTYYPVAESPDTFKNDSNEYSKIKNIKLKSGDSIDVNNYDVKYYDKYKNYEKAFVCLPKNYFKKIRASDSVNIKTEEKIIPFEQIKSIEIEKRKTDKTKTTFSIIIGSVLTILGLYFFLITNYGFGDKKIG